MHLVRKPVFIYLLLRRARISMANILFLKKGQHIGTWLDLSKPRVFKGTHCAIEGERRGVGIGMVKLEIDRACTLRELQAMLADYAVFCKDLPLSPSKSVPA